MTDNAKIPSNNKNIVRAIYTAGSRHDIAGFSAMLDADFVLDAPGYLPWGGRSSRTAYLQSVIPQVVQVLDFTRLRYVSLTAEEDRVVAVIDLGVAGTSDFVLISEHWTVRNEKATALWIAYQEPEKLMARLQAIAA
ncbi:MAG: nuclear transport factor 2 family protein [Ignavibacteriota bacterium]